MSQVFKATAIYTINEISIRYGITVDALHRAIWEHRLPAIRKGNLFLIDPKDVEHAIAMGKLRMKGE